MTTKILAIDDSKTMRLAVKITFAAEDAEVVAVSKGSEAVPRAKQMGADVVLVDHTLAAGEPSGADVCRALKADAATANIPVILLTGGAPDENALRECGADAGIGKPFDTQELIDKVKGVVGKPVAKPSVPATARPAAAAAAAPAPKPAPAPAAAKPPVRAPARPAAPAPVAAASPKPAPKPVAKPAARPISRPNPVAASAPAPAAAAPGGGNIPIAIPIPFTSAAAATPGILKRLQEASGSAAAGLDAKTAAAIVALSKEVLEQVAWEVVPELAEQIIRDSPRSA